MSSPIHQVRRWHEYASATALQDAATADILRIAADSIAARGLFRIVLAGGTTPRGIYARLQAASASWPDWHVYFGDERCLPPDHPERNSLMAAQAWLNRVAIPGSQIHVIPAEAGAEAGAARYAMSLAGIGTFDLVLLGLGEDGHTASLFPGDEVGAAPVVAVFNAPKPPSQRISLGAGRLSAARHVMFLVSGAGKAAAVAAWRNGTLLPAATITPTAGVDIYVDIPLKPVSPENT